MISRMADSAVGLFDFWGSSWLLANVRWGRTRQRHHLLTHGGMPSSMANVTAMGSMARGSMLACLA